jgi:peroxiredoxin
MKNSAAALVICLALFSCSNNAGKGTFTVKGELKGAGNQKVLLEELFFSGKAPEVLDTGMLKDGRFTVSAIAREEGIYRLRIDSSELSYLFINDGESIDFKGNAANKELNGWLVSGPANGAVKKAMQYADSMSNLISSKGQLINTLLKSGAAESDSVIMALDKDYKALLDGFTAYCLAFVDTCKSPAASLFVVGMAPVELEKFEAPLAKLARRFPKHKGIEGFTGLIKKQIDEQKAAKQQPVAPPPAAKPETGSMAPDITMNDINDKPFSLSQLKGKYVLIDFWASWCRPCRDENPNIVATYNLYKDKNFTVLGVSLDKNKAAWLQAIKEDTLSWQQISDLKYWSSAAVDLYGFDGIPYNVLIDPQGKIIATDLRGISLRNKLAEVIR